MKLTKKFYMLIFGFISLYIFHMAKEEKIKANGVVVEIMRDTKFKVQIDDNPNHIVSATISGKMRQHYIRILKGDKVTVELSPYDLNIGIIVNRERNQS